MAIASRSPLEGHHQVQLLMPGEVSNVWLSVRAIIAEVFKILVVGGDGTVRA
jgi:predicted polyphosphate/ATP-dependent NAD kinase